MDFDTLIDRIDENCLQEIFKKALPIINGVSVESPSITSLKEALVRVYGKAGILSNKEVFRHIIPILPKSTAANLCEFIGIQNYDDEAPWQKLESTSLTDNKAQKICSFFGIEYSPVEKKVAPSSITVNPTYQLFKHQIKASNEIKDKLFAQAQDRVLLHMPTGSGKTRTCLNIICEYLRSNPHSGVVWLANTEELCQQASHEFQKAWQVLGNTEVVIQNVWGGNTLDLEINSPFYVFGINTLINLYTNDPKSTADLSKKIGLVVMDEAHMSIAPKYSLAIELLLFNGAKLIGLSATPGRSWNSPDEDKKLSIFYNRQKVTLKIEGYSNPVHYLEDAGYLSKVKSEKLLYNGGVKPTKQDLDYLQENLQLSSKVLKRMSIDTQRNILIVSKIKLLAEQHKRIIAFAMNVDHAEAIAIALSSIGLTAYSVSSKTNKTFRSNYIEHYKSDEDIPIVLCNYGVLTTGFDAPKTSCAVIIRPTDSLVLYSQMMGRAIRGVKAGGSEFATIVTVIDTQLPGFKEVAEAFFNWEDVW